MRDTYSCLIALLDAHGAGYRVEHAPEGRTEIVSSRMANPRFEEIAGRAEAS